MSFRIWLVLGAVAVARAASPSYTAAGIVNAAGFTPGPFAPNSIISIFGTNLAPAPASAQSMNEMPTQLGSTQVFVDNIPAPLLYISPGQINVLIPANQSLGDTKIRVASNSSSGPEVLIPVVDSAPSLFPSSFGYAIATHSDGWSLMTADSPARTNEVIVIYCTGLGKTLPNVETGAVVGQPAQILNLTALQVSLGGYVLTPDLIKYAGVTPGSVGLYQINLAVPLQAGNDPEIRISVGAQTSSPGLKLAVQQNTGN